MCMRSSRVAFASSPLNLDNVSYTASWQQQTSHKTAKETDRRLLWPLERKVQLVRITAACVQAEWHSPLHLLILTMLHTPQSWQQQTSHKTAKVMANLTQHYFQTWLPKYCNAGTPRTSKSTSGASVTCSSLQMHSQFPQLQRKLLSAWRIKGKRSAQQQAHARQSQRCSPMCTWQPCSMPLPPGAPQAGVVAEELQRALLVAPPLRQEALRRALLHHLRRHKNTGAYVGS